MYIETRPAQLVTLHLRLDHNTTFYIYIFFRGINVLVVISSPSVMLQLRISKSPRGVGTQYVIKTSHL